MPGYVPPHVRRGAAERGITVEEYKAMLNAEAAEAKAARAPRNVGAVPRHNPGGSRGRSAMASGRGAAGRSVRVHGRRLRTNMNAWTGVNEVHTAHVEPYEVGDNLRTANYRLHKPSVAVTNFAAFAQKKRRATLSKILAKRKGKRLTYRNAAVLGRLATLPELTSENARRIASIGERIDELDD